MGCLAIITEDDAYECTYPVPEKGVLAAILERAYRDLYSNVFDDFREAIYWFQDKADTPDDFTKGVYFDQIVEILGLSPSRVLYLETKVVEFLPYIKNKEQFKIDRPKVIKIRQKRHWAKGYRVWNK